MIDDYDDYYDDSQESIDSELSYSFASREVQQIIKKGWEELKGKLLSKDKSFKNDIDDFDKLINYYY